MLLFGLALPPQVFSKVLAPVLVLLRQQGIGVTGYFDVLLVNILVALMDSEWITMRSLQVFAWVLNLKKLWMVVQQLLSH